MGTQIGEMGLRRQRRANLGGHVFAPEPQASIGSCLYNDCDGTLDPTGASDHARCVKCGKEWDNIAILSCAPGSVARPLPPKEEIEEATEPLLLKADEQEIIDDE